MDDKETMIHVESLKKSYGKLEVLKDISADIKKGEVVVVIGPSGSGKSTFLRCLNRLEEATGGTIVVNGVDITSKKTDINKVRENIGMVFQHFNLFQTICNDLRFAVSWIYLYTVNWKKSMVTGITAYKWRSYK